MQIEDRTIQILSRIVIVSLALIAITVGARRASAQSATNIYISQSGGGSGTSCASALPVSWFNTAGSWGGASNQIGPGTIVHLCGAITTSLNVQGSGTNGNVIEFLAESGASVQLATGAANVCPFIVNNNSYLLFDGGGAGGTNGILAVLNNGSGLATQALVSAFCNSTSSGNIEIRNWMMGPFYQHTSLSDTTGSADVSTNAFAANSLSGNLSIHDNVIHDVGTAVQLLATISNNPTINIYNNYIYNINWALGFGPASGGSYTMNFHDNHIGSTTNWDTSADAFHHDGIHFYTGDGPNSLATNVYNNLFDGNWGTCCSTAFIYEEFDPIANFNLYNNVFNQYAGNVMPLVEIGPSTGGIYNNTFQCGSGSSNVLALQIQSYGRLAGNIENNIFQGCNTFLEFTESSISGTVDYNTYMAVGAGGNGQWGTSSGGFNAMTAWQGACSCDLHSTYQPTNSLNSNGSLQTASPAITSGTNLTGLAIGVLNNSTTAGNTTTPVPRPQLSVSAIWPAGAFGFGTVANQPAPPAGLTATVN